MDNRIKDTAHIQIERMHIYAYILEDDSRYIGEGIKMYFKGNPDVPLHILIDENNKEIKAYYFRNIFEHLNLQTLQMFARFGLNSLIEEDIITTPKKEKRRLSDFDKLIKKALDYNPKDVKE